MVYEYEPLSLATELVPLVQNLLAMASYTVTAVWVIPIFKEKAINIFFIRTRGSFLLKFKNNPSLSKKVSNFQLK